MRKEHENAPTEHRVIGFGEPAQHLIGCPQHDQLPALPQAGMQGKHAHVSHQRK